MYSTSFRSSCPPQPYKRSPSTPPVQGTRHPGPRQLPWAAPRSEPVLTLSVERVLPLLVLRDFMRLVLPAFLAVGPAGFRHVHLQEKDRSRSRPLRIRHIPLRRPRSRPSPLLRPCAAIWGWGSPRTGLAAQHAPIAAEGARPSAASERMPADRARPNPSTHHLGGGGPKKSDWPEAEVNVSWKP